MVMLMYRYWPIVKKYLLFNLQHWLTIDDLCRERSRMLCNRRTRKVKQSTEFQLAPNQKEADRQQGKHSFGELLVVLRIAGTKLQQGTFSQEVIDRHKRLARSKLSCRIWLNSARRSVRCTCSYDKPPLLGATVLSLWSH